MKTIQKKAAASVRHASTGMKPLGNVEVTAPTREEALAKMRNELRYRSEYCPCTGVTEDFVQLQVREEGGTP